jgi:hypothetical protein
MRGGRRWGHATVVPVHAQSRPLLPPPHHAWPARRSRSRRRAQADYPAAAHTARLHHLASRILALEAPARHLALGCRAGCARSHSARLSPAGVALGRTPCGGSGRESAPPSPTPDARALSQQRARRQSEAARAAAPPRLPWPLLARTAGPPRCWLPATPTGRPQTTPAAAAPSRPDSGYSRASWARFVAAATAPEAPAAATARAEASRGRLEIQELKRRRWPGVAPPLEPLHLPASR